MLITYIRSSSYNNWDFCQMQYFLTYVLGWQAEAGHKAEKGTIVHKVLEILANIKKVEGDTFDDDAIGLVKFDKKTWLKPSVLNDDEIQAINKSRKNKYNYKMPCQLESGHTRLGIPLVEELIQRVYDYYSDRSNHNWAPVDFKDCTNWVWMALDYADGQFDPRKREVVEAEPHFDIEIKQPWAKYDYVLPDGSEIEGHLRIKGTIDLITHVGDGILEIIDWKTGQRLDWANGGTKTYDKLCKDPQLMLYYYAAKHLYPEAKQVILSIFFVRDGGPFSMCFEEDTVAKVEKKLSKRFKEIKNSNNPKMFDVTQKHFKCSKICAFYKNKLRHNDEHNMCKTIHDEVKKHGAEYVTHTMSNPDHSIRHYQNPGA